MEAYNDLIIDDIIRIRGKYILADSMEKPGISHEFVQTLRKGNIHHETENSISHIIVRRKR